MARKPRAVEPATETDATQTAVAEVLTEAQQAMPVLQAAHSADHALVNQLLGQAQMADSIAQFSLTVSTSKMAYVKENGLYKALSGQKTADGQQLSGTWEDFCLLLGKSRQKVDEDILNLRQLGEEALESMTRMGIGYRELRQYRRLPEDEKSALIEIAKAGDKDSLVEFAETIFEKHSKEKTELVNKLDEAKKDLQAKDDVAQENANRIKELQEKVARIKKQPADEVSKENRSEVTTLVNTIDHDLRVNLYNALVVSRDHDDANGIATQEFLKAQIEQLEAATALLRNHLIIGVEWEQN